MSHYEKQYEQEAEKALKDRKARVYPRYPRICCATGQLVNWPCIPNDHCSGSKPMKRRVK